MTSIRIVSPSAASALVLVDLVAEHGAKASPKRDGSWEVVIPLDGVTREIVPACLAATREWLDQCGLNSASVSLDGRTYLMQGSSRRPSTRPVH